MDKEISINLVNRNKGIYCFFLRIIDIILSIVALIVLSPVILLTALAIVIESPGNPFYIQKRVGLMGREFSLIKLRSMKLNAEKDGAQWAKKNDNRITKVGNFIRKTRIDELPQLINILYGDMSLIGPRPERLIFIKEFMEDIPEFPKRLEVKPGLTGWAQVNGGYDITPKEKLKLDLFYIEKKSILLDLRIIFLTVKIVLTGDGAR